jgi:hypothetical protein
MWIGVRQRFGRFHADLKLTSPQYDDGLVKQLGVRQCLQRAYYDASTDKPPGFMVGSWGKGTARRPPRDIDVFFEMPIPVYQRFEAYSGNKQSALLQEVKGHLAQTYPQTTMRGDGQVVIVGFNTVTIEVVPAFRYYDQARFYIPDTNDGGRWKLAAPLHEINSLNSADVAANGNVRPMAQMIKVWKDECKVPLNSFLLEIIAGEFMRNYVYRQYDYFWYDWYMRDFFSFFANTSAGWLRRPGPVRNSSLGTTGYREPNPPGLAPCRPARLSRRT